MTDQPALTTIFSDDHEVGLMIAFEVALAAVQGELGVIPPAMAAEIVRCGRLDRLPAGALAAERRTVAHPLLAFLNVWCRTMENGAGEWVHYGATTMDVMNTVYLQQLRAAAAVFLTRARAIEDSLLALATAHRATPMIGRTLGRHALPITFGFKAATWAAELRRDVARLKAWVADNRTGVLSGAVGTYAAFGARGFEIEAGVMARLGLEATGEIDWKGSRDGYAAFGCLLAITARTLGRIAQEIFLLQGDDLGELAETGSGLGSSTMPHKSNPARCIRAMSLASEIAGYAGPLLDWMVTIYERDSTQQTGPMKAQCLAMEQQLKTMEALLGGLAVNPAAMLRNLGRTNGLILAEDLMFRLGRAIGKQKAHDVVAELAGHAFQAGLTLQDAVRARPDLAAHLSPEDLASLAAPERYIGLAPEAVDRTVAAIRRQREQD